MAGFNTITIVAKTAASAIDLAFTVKVRDFVIVQVLITFVIVDVKIGEIDLILLLQNLARAIDSESAKILTNSLNCSEIPATTKNKAHT